MLSIVTRRTRLSAASLLALWSLATAAKAGPEGVGSDAPKATARHVEGNVWVADDGDTTGAPTLLGAGRTWRTGERIWTEWGSFAELSVGAETRVRFAPRTVAVLVVVAADRLGLRVDSGAAYVHAGAGIERIDIATPAAQIAMAPGVARIDVGPTTTRVTVESGGALLETHDYRVAVQPGYSAAVAPDTTPVPEPVADDDRDAFTEWVRTREEALRGDGSLPGATTDTETETTEVRQPWFIPGAWAPGVGDDVWTTTPWGWVRIPHGDTVRTPIPDTVHIDHRPAEAVPELHSDGIRSIPLRIITRKTKKERRRQ